MDMENSGKVSILDILETLSDEELEMIEKGKEHWNMDILKDKKGGYVSSDTIRHLTERIIENTWAEAKRFYKG